MKILLRLDESERAQARDADYFDLALSEVELYIGETRITRRVHRVEAVARPVAAQRGLEPPAIRLWLDKGEQDEGSSNHH